MHAPVLQSPIPNPQSPILGPDPRAECVVWAATPRAQCGVGGHTLERATPEKWLEQRLFRINTPSPAAL